MSSIPVNSYGEISEVFRDDRYARFECGYPGYFSISGYVGDVYVTPTVRCFGVALELYIRPFGDMVTNDCFELYLVREPEEVIPESILFTIGIKMADGSEQVILRDQKFGKNLKKMESRLLPRRHLLKLKPRLPRTGELTITCTFLREESFYSESKTSVSRETQTKDALLAKSENDGPDHLELEDLVILKENFKTLLQSGNLHDVLITVKDKQFKAHKCVLVARSSVFAAMFRSDMEESARGAVTIEDCDPDAFDEFLQYVYTGKVDISSANVALGLYSAGDKYDFPRLKKICVDFLKVSLSTTTISDVITLAARHGEEELLQLAIVYFSKHMEEIMITVEWLRFLSSNPIQANEMCLKAVQCLKATIEE